MTPCDPFPCNTQPPHLCIATNRRCSLFLCTVFHTTGRVLRQMADALFQESRAASATLAKIELGGSNRADVRAGYQAIGPGRGRWHQRGAEFGRPEISTSSAPRVVR